MAHNIDLTSIRDFLVDIASEAGRMITTATPTTETAGEKQNAVDLVTATDRAVEKMVSSKLKEHYPDFKFVGEETYYPGQQVTDEPTFICDPIDGTTNFVHSYPYVCISLALAVKKVPLVGVVYNPFTNQLYSAIKGQGAFLNRTQKLPLKPTEPLPSLQKALVIIEYGSDRDSANYDCKIDTFRHLAAGESKGGKMVHGFRSFGSAALNLCALASGGCDIYWEGGCWSWDVAAGWVILHETGGLIVDGNPTGNFDVPIDHRKYLAIRAMESEDQQHQIIKEFWDSIKGTMDYTT